MERDPCQGVLIAPSGPPSKAKASSPDVAEASPAIAAGNSGVEHRARDAAQLGAQGRSHEGKRPGVPTKGRARIAELEYSDKKMASAEMNLWSASRRT
jgi:hypothetical protein